MVSKLICVLTLLIGNASAAGILATSKAVSRTAFCQKYSCQLNYRKGRYWLYSLNVPSKQFLLVTRESNHPSSRITTISLHSYHQEINTDLDRQTFKDMQKMALGFISNAGRLEPCYALNRKNIRVLSTTPDMKTQRIYCDWQNKYTRFVLEANRNYLAYTTPRKTRPTGLTNWHFRQCTANGQLLPSIYLPTGIPSHCDLIIQTTGQLSPIVRAEFAYEIEYFVNGHPFKHLLHKKEYWWPQRRQQALAPRLSQTGHQINANLSLNIKHIPDRSFTYLNTIAKLTFANGVVKTAYARLPVR